MYHVSRAFCYEWPDNPQLEILLQKSSEEPLLENSTGGHTFDWH